MLAGFPETPAKAEHTGPFRKKSIFIPEQRTVSIVFEVNWGKRAKPRCKLKFPSNNMESEKFSRQKMNFNNSVMIRKIQEQRCK